MTKSELTVSKQYLGELDVLTRHAVKAYLEVELCEHASIFREMVYKLQQAYSDLLNAIRMEPGEEKYLDGKAYLLPDVMGRFENK
jgi:hypothetical protein